MLKEAIKGYHMFLPRPWLKWGIYLLYPVVVIGMMYVLNTYATVFPFICIGMCCGVILAMEYMLDTYMFFGIASKDTNRLDYLKTSFKGLTLLKKALETDAVRRFLSTAIILTGVYMEMRDESGNFGWSRKDIIPGCVCSILTTCFLMELGFLLTRFFANVWLNLAMVYFLGGIAFVIGIEVGQIAKLGWPPVLVMIFYGIIVVSGRKLIEKRARESYYDT